MTDDITRYDAVEGYCGELSCSPGEKMALHVSSRADRYDVEIHRWGADRQLVWSADDLIGAEHLIPDDADANGCGWPVAVTVPVGNDWRSGFYLVTLRAHGVPADRCHGLRRASWSVPAGNERGRCWCWPRTPTTPTTAGAAAACTPVGGGSRSPDRSGEAC